jgi:hypothetical protein
MTSKPIGIGVIGMGEVHARSYAQLRSRFGDDAPEVRLVVCADDVEARAESSRDKLGFDACVTEWLKVVEDPAVRRLVRIKGVMDGASRQHPGLLWPMLHLFWRCGGQVRLVGAGRLQGSDVASLFHPAPRRERAHGPVTSSWRSANCLVVDASGCGVGGLHVEL